MPVMCTPRRVNLKTPQKTILVQLVRTVCCISVLDSYKELARFNVRKLAEDELEQQVEQKQQVTQKQQDEDGQKAVAAAQADVKLEKQDEKQAGDAAGAAAAEAAPAEEVKAAVADAEDAAGS
eukprot:GHRQ01018969.1.p2 GENE.GHRQ01018969.1~~GHRQ01018969.1.p2  ORF type:complete len:123 (-),score=70.17 GHRQ01018969.1:25-393(-)